MKFQWVTLILVLWPAVTHQRSDADSPSYTAAIVEYSPVVSSPNEENLGKVNAVNYLKIIDKAITYTMFLTYQWHFEAVIIQADNANDIMCQQHLCYQTRAVDIIVFPESSLSISTSNNATIRRSQGATYIPDPIDNIIPCDDKAQRYEYSLTSISCAAKEHKIYVLINHREKVDCIPGEGCSADGFLIYNTNVVFDRNGEVISRYRKYNLFGEYDKNITESVPTTFKTDFGVTFGTFICFDLLFRTPALNLTRDLNVTDILYPLHWFSELPYLYAVEAQAAWAYANDVNILASSYNYPGTASGGSGIFLGKHGPVKVISENRRSNILVVAEIPKIINGKRKINFDEQKLNVYEFTEKEISTGQKTGSPKWVHMRDDLTVYSSELIDVKQKSLNKTICDRGYCCDFKVELEFDETIVKNNSYYYHYRFAVFNGTRIHEVVTAGVKSCGIIACINSTLEGCGYIFPDDGKTLQPTTFVSLEITTPNVANENIFLMPITFTQKMIPLNTTYFIYESLTNSGESAIHHMKLKSPVNNLLTFAIHGRDFSLDGTDVTRGISSTLIISTKLLIMTIVMYALY